MPKIMKGIKPKRKTCDICGYKWWSQSEAEHPSCPHCGGKLGYATRRKGNIAVTA